MKKNIGYILVAILIGIFFYIVIIFMNDILFYEDSLSEVYNVPSLITERSYSGDYVASIIDAKSVKISLLAIIISALGSILTFAAFIIQKQANEIHREDIKTERTIANYTKLMDTHRDTINAVKIGANLQGHSAFHFMFYELKSIYVHLVTKYPYLRDSAHTSIAAYIAIKIFMSGCTGKDDSKLIDGIRAKIGPEHTQLDLAFFTRELMQLNKNFVEKRIPPACFVFAKYENEKEFPTRPDLYKGNLQRLSNYFNLVDVFLSLEGNTPNPQTKLYRQMFAMQFSIHEAAILDIYFRYKQIESNAIHPQEYIALLCDQRKQYPATFDIENADFCKNVN